MSKTPEPDINLDLHFLPAWARQPSEINRYAHYEGRERPERRGGGRRRFDGSPRDRDRSREDRGPQRGGRPGERRGGAQRGRERLDRPRPREDAPPLPNVNVAFVPEPRGVESLARQIKLTGRAYPVFEIAHLILSKPDRYQVTFEVVKQEDGKAAQELWHCSIDNTLWISMEEAVGHVFRKHFEMFYQAEKTPTDPPKGTYTFVAQCGLSGTILGPPNYHDYQVKLRKLHASRYARMPLAAYQAKVRIVRDEAVVKQWVEDQSYTTEYICLNVSEPTKLANRDEAEKHFREVHAGTLIRSVDNWTSSAAIVQQSPNFVLRQLLRHAWEEQRRFPLKVVTVLSQQMAGHGLQFFKVNKTVTHVCVARPHYLDLDETPVSDGVQRIVDYVRTHEGCSRRDLVEALVPTVPPPKAAPSKDEATPSPTAAPEEAAASESPAGAQPGDAAPATSSAESAAAKEETKPTSEQTAVVGDLHWLIHQGHVIEFASGRLESAKKPKPKPEPKPKRAPVEARSVARSVEASPGFQAKTAAPGGAPEKAAAESQIPPTREEAVAEPVQPPVKTEEPGSTESGAETSTKTAEPPLEAAPPDSPSREPQEVVPDETDRKTEPEPRTDASTPGAA